MPIVFGPDNYLATVRQESTVFTDGYALTVLGVERQGGQTPSEIAVAVFGAWADNILPQQAGDTTLTRVEVVNETTFGAATGEEEGGSSASMLASNSSILVSKLTGRRGRRGRGRMFIGNAADEELVFSDGSLEGTYRGVWANVMNAFYSDLDTAGIRLAIPQNQGDNQVTPPIVPWPLVTALQVDAKIGTQRRRMRR